jgi:nitrogen fixation-related uncharacterized protein
VILETTPQAALLILWVTFTVVAVLGIVAALVWAVRTGQFSGQDRARHLPLQSGIPDEETQIGQKEPRKAREIEIAITKEEERHNAPF